MNSGIKKKFQFWAVTGAAAVTVAISLQTVEAQSNTTMQVFAKAMQFFQFAAQNSHRLDNPDGNPAPCRDPWVSSAIRLVFGREPNGNADNGECNYRNFGGGSWSSYRDLVWKTAWYRAYKELGLVRGGNALDESLSTPAGLEPLVKTAATEITTGVRPDPARTGEGYEFVKERVEDVYYACSNNDVSRAVVSVTGRAPRGVENQGECNPLLYGKGKWDNFNDLRDKVQKTLVAKPHPIGVCRDGELTRAITEVKRASGSANPAPSGRGELGECNMYLYGGGHWSSYSDLKSKVAAAFENLRLANVQLQPDNSIKTLRVERGGGQGAIMALLAAANAYMQWKAMQPPKQPKHQMPQMQPGMMQPGMDGGMMQPGMMQPGMMPPGMMQQPMMPGMIAPGPQVPTMPPMQPQMMAPPMLPGMAQPGMMQ